MTALGDPVARWTFGEAECAECRVDASVAMWPVSQATCGGAGRRRAGLVGGRVVGGWLMAGRTVVSVGLERWRGFGMGVAKAGVVARRVRWGIFGFG